VMGQFRGKTERGGVILAPPRVRPWDSV